MNFTTNNFDVAIAGGGPAGSSAAIQLAITGARVLLVEEKKFPRAKLCGEFISPECLLHFKRLGVTAQMEHAGGASLRETVFYSRRGRSVVVPSEWFNSGVNYSGSALGLSRSEMDHRLLQRAKETGVTVFEETHASVLTNLEDRVHGLRLKNGEQIRDFEALVTIDATGRPRALARQLKSEALRQRKRPGLVAFKAHLKNTRIDHGACEIYSYKGGYGGLSDVERGLSNLCFIVSAGDVREFGSDPERVVREIVMKNSRAAYTLAEARACTPWLSVSLEGFGRRTLSPANGLLTIGDAASFIDPFTGSGMLMALESGEVAATIVTRHLQRLSTGGSFSLLANDYNLEYQRRFNSRLRMSGLLRRAAFLPYLAEATILLFGTSTRLRRRFARATRRSDNQAAQASTV